MGYLDFYLCKYIGTRYKTEVKKKKITYVRVP